MLIRRFFINFADFWASFKDQQLLEQLLFYLSNFYVTVGYTFVDLNYFFLRNMTKNGGHRDYFSQFFAVFRLFSVFKTSFLAYYDLPIILRPSGYPIG